MPNMLCKEPVQQLIRNLWQPRATRLRAGQVAPLLSANAPAMVELMLSTKPTDQKAKTSCSALKTKAKFHILIRIHSKDQSL